MSTVGSRPPDCSRFRFGAFEIDFANSELLRNGFHVQLQRKAFSLLTSLLKHPGQIISREDLCSELWPGERSGSSLRLNTTIRKLRIALRDTAHSSKYIETMAGLGYRFIATVRQSDIPNHQEQTPERLRIAIVPFEDLSAQVEDRFSEALTDMIIASLACASDQIEVFFVPETRHSSYSEIACAVDAPYVMTGSVFRTAGYVEVNTKLVHASNSRVLWAHSCGLQRDMIADPEEISRQITDSLFRKFQLTPQTTFLAGSLPGIARSSSARPGVA